MYVGGMTAQPSHIKRHCGALTLGALALLFSSCTSGSEGETQAQETIETSVPDSVAAPEANLDLIASATMLVETEGNFSYSGSDEIELFGGGSAFFIDQSGIAVTNHHVVGGAGIVRVFLAGEDQPRSARVLGVSECSDLAVLKIEGQDFPALRWYSEPITPGLDVYAAGYTEEYNLTRGIVTRAPYRVEMGWASTEGVLEHDARILPGNSGGPLVTPDGQVVGVNYAATDFVTQSFAIGASTAASLVERLKNGEDIDSIGVNGEAFEDLEEDVRGVWVISVATGSPAFNVGIRAGDVITRLENLAVGRDATMAGYCEVIRSTRVGDQIRVEVYRPSTEKLLAGELNGEKLAVVTSFLDGAGASRPSADEAFVEVTDDSGRIRVEVPTRWADVDGSSYRDNRNNLIFDVVVAEDVDAFYDSWDASGVRISASYDLARSTNEIELLEQYFDSYASDCEYEGTEPYEDAFYTGEFDVFSNCGGIGTGAYVLAVVPTHRSFVIWIEAVIRFDRDLAALDRILASFVFD